jgi:enoyl-CoA hydratase
MTDDILFHAADGVGAIVLNRPQVLNALTPEMIAAMHRTLDAWAADPDVRVVLLKGEGKAFCAGGDIRAVRQASLEERHDDNRRFFATEYDLDFATSVFPKPYISLIDGICMGGGMGLAMHGAYRVVTERATLAMPETMIGFFPDVGGTHTMARLPGGIGLYLGLTGARVDAADALYCGLATHFLPAEELGAFEAALRRDPAGLLTLFAALPKATGESALARHRGEIDAAFADADLPAIFARLAEMPGDWAAKTLATLRAVSPDALRLTARLIAAAKGKNLRACLDAELDAAIAAIRTPDFLEGVRSMLVDKDRKPAWTSRPIEG